MGALIEHKNGTAGALTTNFMGSQSDPLGHVGWRVAIVAAAAAATGALWTFAFRDRPRRR